MSVEEKSCYHGKLRLPEKVVQDLNDYFHFTSMCGELEDLKFTERNLVFARKTPAKYIEKVVFSGKTTAVIVYLKSNSQYWHNLVFPNIDALWMLSGSLKFQGYKDGSPLPFTILFFYFPDEEIPRIQCPSISALGSYNFTSLKPIKSDKCKAVNSAKLFVIGPHVIYKDNDKFYALPLQDMKKIIVSGRNPFTGSRISEKILSKLSILNS